jgi:hypothetical protein
MSQHMYAEQPQTFKMIMSHTSCLLSNVSTTKISHLTQLNIAIHGQFNFHVFIIRCHSLWFSCSLIVKKALIIFKLKFIFYYHLHIYIELDFLVYTQSISYIMPFCFPTLPSLDLHTSCHLNHLYGCYPRTPNSTSQKLGKSWPHFKT